MHYKLFHWDGEPTNAQFDDFFNSIVDATNDNGSNNYFSSTGYRVELGSGNYTKSSHTSTKHYQTCHWLQMCILHSTGKKSNCP